MIIKKNLGWAPGWYLALRRSLVDLFRGSDRAEWLQPITVIHLAGFGTTLALWSVGVEWHPVPIVSTVLFHLTVTSYFALVPLTWSEMTGEERAEFRKLWMLPDEWEPEE